MTRKVKRTVRIGNITIGGNNPIAVQTMLNIPLKISPEMLPRPAA